MTLRTKRRLLILTSLFLFMCAAGVAVWPDSPWGKGDAFHVAEIPSPIPVSESPVPEQPAEQHLTPQDFRTYWTKLLRQPLFDPPPPPPKVVEKPQPRPLTARLIATMVEPGNSMAMLQLSSGEVVIRKLGDEIGAADTGAVISAIDEGVIKVVCNEVESKLMVPGQGGN